MGVEGGGGGICLPGCLAQLACGDRQQSGSEDVASKQRTSSSLPLLDLPRLVAEELFGSLIGRLSASPGISYAVGPSL